MPFIDVSVKERKGGIIAKFKVEAEVTDLFKTVVAKAIIKYLRKTSSDDLPIIAVRRIRSVECNDNNFEEELESATATIEALNSDNTPILVADFNIELNPLPKETEKAVNDSEAMKAMDHDFHVGNIIPSVTLLIGDEDGGRRH